MKKIEFTNPHRQKHFDFFSRMDQPHFNICANVDIGNLHLFIDSEKLPFTLTMVYLLSNIANSIPQFKQRIRNNQVFEHDFVHPSFSVTTQSSDVFSFCHVKYSADYQDFIKRGQNNINAMQSEPIFEDDPNRDDFLFMSSIPWISFTGFNHAMHYSPVDSVPRLVWGKYFKENGRLLMPLSIQAHHAMVDGQHMGLFFQKMEEFAAKPKSILF